METQFDTEAYSTFPQNLQKQVLDNASNFYLSSYLYNGTLADYVTDNILEYDLTDKSYPSLVLVMINRLSYFARIIIYQTNLTLYSTSGGSRVELRCIEYDTLAWDHYFGSQPYWISPSLNFSLTEDSSANLSGPVYFCEFDVRVQFRSMWGDRCTLMDRCVLDSNGQILIITRLHACSYYI